MTTSLCVFRSTPPTKKHEDYILWLNKIELKKSEFWKERGIFELIQLSRTGPAYFQNMIVISLYFWESTTNTFQLPCRMLTFILFDVATIIDLRSTGETFDPNKSDEDTINFNGNHASFSRYIED